MNGRFQKTLSAALAAILLCLCACGKLPAGVSKLRVGSENRVPAVQPAYHLSLPAAQKNVASASGFQLFFDETSGAVSVYDAQASVRWNALPDYENTACAVLAASLVSSAGRVTLNSQDNCAAFGSFTHAVENGVLRVTYSLAENAASAAKSPDALSDGELFVRVPVVYSLTEDGLSVSVDCAQICVSSGYVLEKLALLPSFGALLPGDGTQYSPASVWEPPAEEPSADKADAENGDEEEPLDDGTAALSDNDLSAWTETTSAVYRDFLLVPDGCGAVMYTDTPAAMPAEAAFPLYSDGEKGARARVGCFGVNRDRNGFVGVICEGDALASVRAVRAEAHPDGLNVVYPEFTLTASALSDGTYYHLPRYTGGLRVIYKFVRDTGGSAVGMAAACREALIRCGTLPADDTARTGFPLNVTFVMSADGKKDTVTTRLEQAEELAGLLKAKGVSEMNLVLDGLFTGGIYQTGSSSMKIGRGQGDKKDLQSLCDYAAAQGFRVYAGVNLLYASSKRSAAKDLQGGRLQYFVKNPLAPYLFSNGKNVYLASMDAVDKNTAHVINGTKDLPVAGYAVNDAGNILYADASAGVDAAGAAARIREDLSALTAEKKLLVNGADFCMLKNASVVTDVPMRTSYAETDAYEAVPLVQAILHGTVVYSGAPANAESLYLVHLLKSVEYGAALHAEWVYNADSILYYEQTYTEIAEFYVRAAKTLDGLAAKRITGHERLSEGVYATVYDGGSVVFVNYNNYTVNVGNICVPPYDFLRIN